MFKFGLLTCKQSPKLTLCHTCKILSALKSYTQRFKRLLLRCIFDSMKIGLLNNYGNINKMAQLY